MLDTILDIKADVQHILLVLLAVAAWRYGAAPERLCTAILMGILWLGDVGNHWLFDTSPRFTAVETGHLVLDLTAFAGLLVIAVMANRLYPLWLAGLQGLVVLTHFAQGLTASAPLADSILSIAPFYGLIAILAGGIFAHRRRKRQFGSYAVWTIHPPTARREPRRRL
ncbi:hypothetical protein K3177_15100 [Qipengyuania sp. GH25]|uniref:Uncharacterized protein n=1 Tax=Qipengyuania pacifica TaxID=2860199 RepID=A0ABS7JKB7_9SPHN|nr:hypothetical protein [Qipengyuania aerophila]MBX7489834.1 hypothetical protein [Qipengyuania aerophila]